MAEIYQSQGEQVALTGPSRLAGFDPVQAFDPSQQMLASAQQQASMQQRNVEALTAFSKTLSDTLVEKAKEQNKAAYLRGLSGLSSGNTVINPQVVAKQQAGALVLKSAAEADLKVANELSQTDPVQGERFYQRSKAVSGWEAYGQAVREAQTIGLTSKAFFTNYLQSTDPTKKVFLPDGRSILPAEARSEEELSAVMAQADVEFLQSTGLEQYNPAIIVEHVLPNLNENKSSAYAGRFKEILANQTQDKLNRLQVGFSRQLPDLDKVEKAQGIVSKLFDDIFLITRDRKTANELGRDILIENLKPLIEQNPTIGLAVKNAIGQSYINPSDPSLGRLDERFPSEFKALGDIAGQAQDKLSQNKQADVKKRIAGAVAQYQLASQTGTLTEAQRAYDATRRSLEAISKEFPVEGAAALLEFTSNDRNYSQKNAQAIVDTVKDPAELDAFLVKGYITQEQYKEATSKLPTSSDRARIKSIGQSLIKSFSAQIAEKFQLAGDPENATAKAGPVAQQLVNELMVYANQLAAIKRAQGETVPDNVLLQEMMNRGADQLRNNARFQVKEVGGIVQANLYDPRFSSATIKLPNGKTVDDLINQSLSRLPKVTSAYSKALTKEEVESNVAAIRNGGKPDERVSVIAAAAGVPTLEFLRIQAQNNKINTAELDSTSAVKRYRANLALDPVAASILANPRSTALELQMANMALQRRRAQTSYQQSYTQGNAYSDLRQAILSREGGASSYNAANKGFAGDTPGGVPNLTNLTIQEVLNLYDQKGFAHLGGYQFKKSTLQTLLRDTNISPTEKFTPQIQDKLFESYFTRGSNGRTRLSQYVSGQSNDLRGAIEDLSLEFAAVKSLNGRSAYEGTAGNSASLDAAQLLRRMREERINYGQPVDMSSRNIQSVRTEVPGQSFQPGFDLWFADKRFGAVLPGVVKEIRRNNGNYGNTIIVESIDTLTNEKVDVVYAHLASISVAPGQRVRGGQLMGMQGGTGRVNSTDGTIASVDFYAPAPKGSQASTPYKYWKQLVQRLKTSIESNQFQ